MSEHGGEAHGTEHGHDAHAADHSHGHDAHDHGGHGHDDHGHGGHGGEWVDYNAKPPLPSALPPVPVYALAIMGVVLALLLGMIVRTSLVLAANEGAGHGGHSAHEAEKENTKKAEH